MMITKIFTKKGQKLSKQETFKRLMSLNPTDFYAHRKASGAIGGAIAHGFIEDKGDYYECVRNPNL